MSDSDTVRDFVTGDGEPVIDEQAMTESVWGALCVAGVIGLGSVAVALGLPGAGVLFLILLLSAFGLPFLVLPKPIIYE